MWVQQLLLVLLFLITSLHAERSYYSDANRSLYNSPVSRALGGADMALSSEGHPSGSPAGIILQERPSIYLGYAGFYQNIFGATTASLTIPVDSVQSAGLSVSYLSIPDVDSVSVENHGEGVPSTVTIVPKTSSELYINFVYGRKIFDFSRGFISVGGAVHMKRLRLIEWTGYGIGADLAAHTYFNNGVAVALKMENFFTEYNHWSSSYHENGLPKLYFATGFERELNRKFAVKLAYKSPELLGNSGVGGNAFSESGQFDSAPERISVKRNPIQLLSYANYGAEILFKEVVAVRTGLTDTKMLTFGGGVTLFESWNIDFVYAHSNALEGTYSLSTRLDF